MTKQYLKPLALAASLSLALAACGKSEHAAAPAPAKPASTAPAKAASTAAAMTAKPKSVFDVSELGPSSEACQDFNTFVNAKWVAANPIPADRTRWGAFDELAEKSLDDQHQIAENAAKNAATAKAGSIEQKIGWLYDAGMDKDAINKAGFDPIKPQLAEIAALKNSAEIATFLDKSFNNGDSYVFSFGSGADQKDASKQIGYVFESGLGLPTKDYYLKPQYKKIREAYVAYITKSLELTGVSDADAKKQAGEVMKFETELAKASLTPTEMRNLDNQYHWVTVKQADRITPHFSWQKFFAAQGVDVGGGFSLSQPKFMAEFDRLLAHAPVSQWQAYLRFHLISSSSPALSDAFQANRFDFYGKELAGQPEQRPRWKRVMGGINGAMGMGLGQLYVAKYFPADAKARAEQLVTNVRNALKNRIEHLDWMSEATKKKALQKWSLFLPKIGYPDKGEWRDWSGLDIQQGQWFADLQAASKYNYHFDLSHIGKKTDRKEWGMTPQTVNAYYDPSTNTINFPAAILQPPFFYAHGDDAINYGGIGAVIGHESSHGFDDQGSQFDGYGNRVNWWTAQDKKQFDERTKALVEQFDAYTPIKGKPNLHVNGKLTLGENIADLGGLNIAYDALQTALKNHPKEAAEKIDGYTEDQRFFLNWARVWRGNVREKAAELYLNIDPHSPASIRAIAAPSNMTAFAKAFECKPTDPMVRAGKKQVKIW
ncbi:M13 family metallopeptidase [Dyella sp. A6]|uniref:M13 family metallopeptidase n=1 Tax=Dyella aluminiiresistens TaxID=3069105 RepID=UPI002E785252|nr:M13 family metallopeptidase [Dyella sp. A6]